MVCLSAISAMALRLLHSRLAAAQVVLHADSTEKRSNQVADGILQFLSTSSLTLQPDDSHAVLDKIQNCSFAVADVGRVVDAIIERVKHVNRRSAAVYHPNIIEMFTESEWGEMPGNSSVALQVILKRVVLLRGLVLNEFSTKYLTSLWIHFQGCHDTLTAEAKKTMHNHLKAEHKKAVRDIKSDVYIANLPKASELRSQFPAVFATAYVSELPVMPKPDIVRAVFFIDQSYSCRGGVGHNASFGVGLAAQPALDFGIAQCLQTIAARCPQLGQFLRQEDAIPNMVLYPPQGRTISGRPMRSMQNMLDNSGGNVRRALSLGALAEPQLRPVADAALALGDEPFLEPAASLALAVPTLPATASPASAVSLALAVPTLPAAASPASAVSLEAAATTSAASPAILEVLDAIKNRAKILKRPAAACDIPKEAATPKKAMMTMKKETTTPTKTDKPAVESAVFEESRPRKRPKLEHEKTRSQVQDHHRHHHYHHHRHHHRHHHTCRVNVNIAIVHMFIYIYIYDSNHRRS